VETPWATNERVAALEETKFAMDFPGNADPNAYSNGVNCAKRSAEPKWAVATEVHAVEPFRDAEGRGKTAGAARQVKQSPCTAVSLHQRNSLNRLDSAQQDARADSRRFARNVQHEMIPISEVDVSVAAIEKERTISRSEPSKGMRGGITGKIGFRLHDTATQHGPAEIVDQSFPDQKPRQFGCI
jgi:hypothetical protein